MYKNQIKRHNPFVVNAKEIERILLFFLHRNSYITNDGVKVTMTG